MVCDEERRHTEISGAKYSKEVVSAMHLKAHTIETKVAHRKFGQTDVCIRSFISRWIKDSSFAV